MAITYDPNVDYSDLIAQEAAKGVNANRDLLAQYETQRNQKIQDQGLNYAQTNIYTGSSGGGWAGGGKEVSGGIGSAGVSGSGGNGAVSVGGSSSAAVPSGGYYTANDQSGYINNLYDAALESAQAALKGAYDEAVLGFDAAEAKIPEQYRAARNQTAADAAVQRANMNEVLNASGLNTGASGQARLAMGIAEQNAMAELNRQQQAAIDEITLQRNQARVQYETAIAQAVADNDIERARALYEEAVRVDNSYRSHLEDALQQQQYQMNQLSMEATRQQMQLAAAADAREQQLLEYELSQAAAGSSGGSGGASYTGGGNNVPTRNDTPTSTDSDQPWEYSGTPYGYQQTTGQISANAQAVLDQLSRIPGMTNENKVAYAQDYLVNGLITEGDYLAIRNYLGL